MPDNDILLDLEHLQKYYPIQRGVLRKTVGHVKAVDDVSLFVKRGETLGLVGESGCGKTTLGKCIVRLHQPTAGELRYNFNGEFRDLLSLSKSESFHARKKIQMVFQDPYSSLNPRMTVEDIIGEPLDVHKLYTNRGERRDKILNLMELVGLNAEHATRYAHEFSGGQRQRIAIARAIYTNPQILILDEATSALDSESEKKITEAIENLIKDKITFVIAHRLSTIKKANKIALLKHGQICALGSDEELLASSAEYHKLKGLQH